MAVLGLDLGTSAVKALVLSDAGHAAAVASAPSTVDRPHPGWAEADPRTWVEAAGSAVREALAAAGDEPIEAIGLAGQMHGVVLCDAAGLPLRPALLWPDRRAAPLLDRWRSLLPERLAALANPLVPGMAGPMLAWLAQEDPAIVERATWALQPKDWLRLVLTGDALGEPTDASATLLWDVPADAWATDVAASVGVDPGLLPPLVASDAVAGNLNAGAAALGLPAGTPVYAGAADTAAALVGVGAAKAGERVLNVGTGAQLVTVVDNPHAPERPTTHRYRAARGGWYAMAAVQNAGLALGWARDVLGMSWEDAEQAAFTDATPSADAPLFVPHLTGERTPLLDPGARGAWTGLALQHGRADLIRAVYEGVAHAIRHARDALDAEGTRGQGALLLLGGGSMRPGYRQLLADVLAEPLVLLDVPHATTLGAARLAGGVTPDPARGSTVLPDEYAAARADARYARWREVVDELRQA
ncbi:MAG: xylulokinase [Thermoleophilales bacterium]|nr:xylulokinase [Thermoleophilales bacterium]